MEYLVWVNGEYVPRSQAKISMLDRGFRMSDVVYDTLRTFGGRLFKTQEHLDRFARTLKFARMDPGMTVAEMGRLLQEVVRRNEPIREPSDDYMISSIVTRGTGYPVTKATNPTVAIFIDPIDYPRYAQLYRTGASVVIPKTRAISSIQMDPKVKNFSRLNFVMADLEATDVDPEAFPVLLDLEGNVAESIGSNFLIVSNGVVRTPRDDAMLQGVSRATALELAQRLDIPTSQEALQPYDVYNADEAFLCSTPYCLLPVSRVDNRPIGTGKPGPVTTRLLAAWSEMVGLDIVDQAAQRANALAGR